MMAAREASAAGGTRLDGIRLITESAVVTVFLDITKRTVFESFFAKA